MTTIEAPTSISREAVLDFVRSLGIDPEHTLSLTIDPSRVELVMWATNDEGKRYCHPKGDVATHTISMEIK